MPDEEAFLVIVCVDEPCGDVVLAAGAHFAGLGVEHIDAQDLNDDFAVLVEIPFDVWFAEYDEQIARTRVLEFVGHMQLGIHLGLEDRQRPQLVEFGRMGLEVEAAGYQRVEARIQRFARSGGQVGAADRAEFRADEDGSAFFALSLHEPAFGGDPRTWPAGDGREGDAVGFLGLLDTRVSRCSRIIAVKSLSSSVPLGSLRLRLPAAASSSSTSSPSLDGTTRWGERLSTVNGPVTRMRDLSS